MTIHRPPQMQPQPTNDMIFVLGEVEAQSFPVAPNNTVVLWDKDQHTIYIKSNIQGIPSMRVLDYVERTAASRKETAPGVEYVSIEAFRALEERLAALEAKKED